MRLFIAIALVAGCGSITGDEPEIDAGADSSPVADTELPFPIDRGGEPGAPETYRGLPLALIDSGEPAVEAVDGVIGLVCVGPSFANMECGTFERELETTLAGSVSEQVVFANCGVGGAGMEAWTDPSRDPELWDRCINEVLPRRGLRADQVRVLLHKAVDAEGASTAGFPDPGADYFAALANLDRFAARLPEQFPELDAVYTFGRSFGGYNPEPGRAEPRAYESSHAINTWLADIPAEGDVWFGWGPYIWAPDCADGVTNGSGICYERDDFLGDGLHPAIGARQKIAGMLHARLSEHAWYRP